MNGAVAGKIKSVRAEQLTIGESIVSLFTDIGLLELLFEDVELVNVFHSELSCIDFLAVENTELLESGRNERGLCVQRHPFSGLVMPSVLFRHCD